MIYNNSYLAPLTTVYRQRTLPVPGMVLRRVGDQVSADSVIAETNKSMGYRLLDLETLLGTRVPDARKVLVKKLKEPFKAGEIIAQTGLLIKSKYASPVDGKIIDARRNKVLIEVATQYIELTAFYPGKVVNIIPELGVELEVTGAVIQGVWGTGDQIRAKLHQASPDSSTPMQADMMTAKQMGMILIGGRTCTLESIEKAIEIQASALIVGSISSDLRQVLDAAAMPIIVTEGFGDLPMNANTFELLCSYAGREASLDPTTMMRWKNHRPEVIIPLPASDQRKTEDRSLEIGTRVRALRVPYQGMLGTVVSLPPHLRRVESGIQTRGAEVDLESTGKTFIPFENLEIVH
ncbi:MAG: hypothetical protein JXA89_18460 [Anaerolineae bacterium]|nr:hypothetical protein [Anaerolineae bacterium]